MKLQSLQLYDFRNYETATSDIKVKLEENKNDFKMVPGFTIDKDPKVTVLAGSEECFLFVKLDESANFGTYLEYAVADGWERLEKDIEILQINQEKEKRIL